MEEERDYFKLLTGKTLKEATRIPTLDEVVHQQWKELHIAPGEELLSLGISQEQGDLWVTQAEREDHFWILGSTGEGKSKFLEYLIRKDIDRLQGDQGKPKNKRRSCSLCFIDSTPNGNNARQILNYCARIGFKKVFLVDASTINTQGKVPPINPFNYDNSYIVDSVDYLRDAFRVLFDIEDESSTAYITTYLTAIFTILHYAGLTLRELIYFTLPYDKTNDVTIDYSFQREAIYDLARERMKKPDFPPHHKGIVEKHIAEIQFAFKNIPNFTREAGSTARRLNQLINNPNLSLIFGHRKGINFDKLVSDGWVLLVNAATGNGMGTLQTRLLSTVIINQIIQTIERLRKSGFNKPYYLYLDEAQRYATDKLVEVLDTKRNIKLRMILANHFPSQFKPRIMKSVQSQTKTKIAFYVEDDTEREEVAKQFYGGKLPINEIKYALRQQKKRQAVMKLGKQGSVIAKTHDVDDSPFNKDFFKELLNTRNYPSIPEVLDDYDDRFPDVSNSKSPKPRTTPNSKATGKAAVPGGIQSRTESTKKQGVPEGDKKSPDSGEERAIKI